MIVESGADKRYEWVISVGLHGYNRLDLFEIITITHYFKCSSKK
jgi:hypothetical protein